MGQVDNSGGPPIINISKTSLERLPIYYRALLQARKEGQPYISSDEIGKRCGVQGTQVRKDLIHFKEIGKPALGYDVDALLKALENFLGLSNHEDAILIGCGNIGRALCAFPGFAPYGIRIALLFDHNPVKIGTEINGREIHPTDKMEEYIKRLDIRLGIITTPAGAAQTIANRMADAGVRGIWNFAPITLTVPETIFVKNVDLAANLAVVRHHAIQD